MVRKTHEQFIKEVYDLVKDEYTILEEYVKSSQPILIKHNKCNNTYKVRPSDFLSHGNRCPYCSNNRKKTINDFKNEIFKIVGNEYEVISENYTNNKEPILIKHNKCGYSYKVAPVDFISHNHRCPYCNGGSKSKEVFLKKMENYKDFKIISDFKTENDEVVMRHLVCNNDFLTKPNLFFKRKCKCPICDNNKKTHEEFIKEISKIVSLEEYIPISIYKGYREDFEFKHTKCNRTYKVKPYRFLQGDRCPYCKRSKGEEKIINWLESNNYLYEQQFSFNDLYYKTKSHPLTFDIRILCENPNDYILIEYDGEFHESNKFSNDSLINQQKRDKLKDDYCKSRENIDFYRINYRDYENIETILENIFNNYI